MCWDPQTEDTEIEIPLPEPPPERPEERAAKPKTEKKDLNFEKRKDRPANGVVYLDDPKLFYGKNINNQTKPISSITEDDKEISCWGHLFIQ